MKYSDIIQKLFEYNDPSKNPKLLAWLGNSKVKYPVYHGTHSVIDKFKKRGVNVNFYNAQRLVGFFFTDNPQYASQYAQKDGGNIIPVYLKIKNPFITDGNRIDDLETISDSAVKKWVKRIKDKGHDGIIFELSDGTKEIVVFSPNQIKSVFAKEFKDSENISESVSFKEELKNNYEIAEYISDLDPKADLEFMEEYFNGSRAVLKRVPIDSIQEGHPDINIPNKAKEKRYSKLNIDTMPPLVVENGIVMDGNHRFRVAKSLGLETILIYDVI